MTKNEIKQLKQLQQKKYRKLQQTFVVEGLKSIREFIKAGFIPVKIYSLEQVPVSHSKYPVEIITNKQLQQISFLKHPKDALAVFKMKTPGKIQETGLVLALDDLQDPGNLGTIIRTADWFGFRQIVCSKDTVDCYNPKVVQATMGSLANVNIIYTDLQKFLEKTSLPVYGTFLEGDNIYKTKLPENAMVVIGNEGNGIKPQIAALIQHKITIPKASNTLAESLNASVAAAVVMNEFFRRFQ
jgi:TrmH family RNA methyltransferase